MNISSVGRTTPRPLSRWDVEAIVEELAVSVRKVRETGALRKIPNLCLVDVDVPHILLNYFVTRTPIYPCPVCSKERLREYEWA